MKIQYKMAVQTMEFYLIFLSEDGYVWSLGKSCRNHASKRWIFQMCNIKATKGILLIICPF